MCVGIASLCCSLVAGKTPISYKYVVLYFFENEEEGAIINHKTLSCEYLLDPVRLGQGRPQARAAHRRRLQSGRTLGDSVLGAPSPLRCRR